MSFRMGFILDIAEIEHSYELSFEFRVSLKMFYWQTIKTITSNLSVNLK
jgi:hypothetical protein